MDPEKFSQQQSQIQRNRLLAVGVAFLISAVQFLGIYLYYQAPVDMYPGRLSENRFVLSHALNQLYTNGAAIVAINDIPIRSHKPYDFGAELIFPTGEIAGETFHYTFENDQENTWIETVTPREMTIQMYLSRHRVRLIAALFFLGMGLFIVLKKPLDSKAWLYFLFITFAGYECLVFEKYLTMSNYSWQKVMYYLRVEGSLLLSATLFLHFALTFARGNTWKKRFLLMPYMLWLLVSVIVFTSVYFQIQKLFTVSWLLAHVLILTFAATGVGVLFRSYRKSKDPITRSQIKWLLWSLSIAIIPFGFIDEIAILTTGNRLFSLDVISMVVLVIPIGTGIAIARYNLFKIDDIITKSVIYALSTLSVVLVYFLSSVLFSLFLNQELFAAPPTLVNILSIGLTIALFNPVRKVLQRVVDRIFFKNKIETETLMRDLSSKITSLNRFDEIHTLITKNVPQIINAKRAWLFLEENKHWQKEAEDSALREATFAFMRNHSPGIQIIEATDLPRNSPLRSVKLIIPVRHVNKVLGYLILADKPRPDTYSSKEIQALESISYQIGLAIKHVEGVEELKAEKNQIEHVLSQISEGVCVIDENGVIVRHNLPFLEIIETQDILHKTYQNVFNNLELLGNKSFKLTQVVAHSLKHKTSYSKFHTLSKAGYKKPVVLNLTPLLIPGNDTAGLLITIYDRSEEAKIMALKDSFLATVAHELRTPITTLFGYWQVYKSKVDANPRVGKAIDKALKILKTRVEQTVTVSETLMETSKFERQVIHVEKLLISLVKEHRELAEKNGNKLKFIKQQKKAARIQVNEERLRVVIEELLKNALEFTKHGSVKVTLEARMRAGGEESSFQEEVVIAVADTGPGIDEAIQSELFNPFIQEGGFLNRNQQKGGFGLGLYTAKILIEKLGGEIWYSTETNKGTTFYVAFPVLKK